MISVICADGSIEYPKSQVDLLLNNKLDKLKVSTDRSTQYTLNGSIPNLVFVGADGNNQYFISAYIYSTTLFVKSLSGNGLPSQISFTKSGYNIIMTVPAYWLVEIL